jgi:zinc/manganese transport system substrate-binding protein
MKKIIIPLVAILIILGIFGLVASHTNHTNSSPSTKIQVVAAENFYGDIATQLAGNKAQVVSIISDPNTDPHEYESTVNDAKDVSNATIVIKNGDDYDTWMDKLLSASPNSKRVVVNAADIAPRKLEDNPHLWYGVDNVQAIAAAITTDLKKEDPADSASYDSNLQAFDKSLQQLQQKMNAIKAKNNGTPVGLTETIGLYQTQQMGLNVLTPLAFERAIAEGNDPSADDVAKANDQITGKQVKVLIYNSQTVTPITTNLENEAKQAGIPIVPVTETMPRNVHYQEWMMDQLTNLQQALSSTSVSH